MEKKGYGIKLKSLIILQTLGVFLLLMWHSHSFAANAIYHATPTVDGQISPGEYPTVCKVTYFKVTAATLLRFTSVKTPVIFTLHLI